VHLLFQALLLEATPIVGTIEGEKDTIEGASRVTDTPLRVTLDDMYTMLCHTTGLDIWCV
jgi:hypothetical protein